MCREIRDKRTVNDKVNVIISIHTHNDRGTGIAATELAIKAGADRVEGVLLGNGERTGNVPIDVVALNMMSQGISPELDLSEWGEKSKIISELTNIPIPERYPYIGKFVNLAFSGSHQDAIKKCFDYCKGKVGKWINAYLPFDPKDIGLKYEPIVVNSQSGKGGVAYILQQNGYEIPKNIQKFVGEKIQEITDTKKDRLENEEIIKIFEEEFINNIGDIDYSDFDGNKFNGDGIIEKFSNYILEKLNIDFNIKSYEQKSLTEGKTSDAISYFILEIDGKEYVGVGVDKDVIESNKKGIIGALNKYLNN
ncbi:MAG: alpha-isopropylmalate synthase regulatory domain-containing protein [Candidatus Gracilibacteria bacterium]|nr:alpha-isopropylmalate synthase regulatory domain-containing protein [Candidatus Gracilibacteria bacterium]